LSRRGRLALAEAHNGDDHKAERQQSVAKVANEMPSPKAHRQESVEGGIAKPPRVLAIERREQGECGEEESADDVSVVERDHGAASAAAPAGRCASARFSARSSIHNRTLWMRSAAIAVGMAQMESCNGSTTIPLASRNPLISRIEAMPMKIASPTKSPRLSAAAASERMMWRSRAGRTANFTSAAPSAIGATSGRTICA